MTSSNRLPDSTKSAVARIVAINEKVTGPAGAEMLRLARPFDSPFERLDVMDNACGGGILTHELHKLAAQDGEQSKKLGRVVACDHDESMLDITRQRVADSHWEKVEVMEMDQQSPPQPDESFSHVFNNFGVFFAPDDSRTVSETHRILRRGGTAGFATWKSIGWWPSLAVPALAAFVPDAPPLPHPATTFADRGWNDETAIPARLESAGFRDVTVAEFAFTPDVGPDEFAEACAALTKVLTKKLWSERDNERFAARIEPAFRRYLMENFPHGRWDGRMVALISLGRKL